MFCDEPTSGLSATDAEHVVRASGGKKRREVGVTRAEKWDGGSRRKTAKSWHLGKWKSVPHA